MNVDRRPSISEWIFAGRYCLKCRGGGLGAGGVRTRVARHGYAHFPISAPNLSQKNTKLASSAATATHSATILTGGHYVSVMDGPWPPSDARPALRAVRPGASDSNLTGRAGPGSTYCIYAAVISGATLLVSWSALTPEQAACAPIVPRN